MTDTRVSVLTPPGSGAIAVLAVRGPRAWAAVRELFRPAGGRPLPDEAPAAGLWFGRFGESTADEVVLSGHGPDRVEVHCHGGRQAVSWLIGLLKARGITEESSAGAAIFADPAAGALLPFARTARTAAILLDQAHGAYLRAVERVETGGPGGAGVAATLRRNSRVGRHLVEPWRVVIAGPPNAGKSSLLNALAGFARSVVSPVPGTTRDAVSVSLAFDGWPVDVSDTAGLRESSDAIEREGVDRARSAAAGGDLVLWVVDATGRPPESVSAIADALAVPPAKALTVVNKMDLAGVSEAAVPGAVPVSALTGQGVAELIARVASALVPEPPAPGDPVPYTPELSDRWS